MKQFEMNRRFDRMFNLNPMDHYGDEHLSFEEARLRKIKTDIAVKRIRESGEGEVLGHFVYDHENQTEIFMPIDKSDPNK